MITNKLQYGSHFDHCLINTHICIIYRLIEYRLSCGALIPLAFSIRFVLNLRLKCVNVSGSISWATYTRVYISMYMKWWFVLDSFDTILKGTTSVNNIPWALVIIR